VDLLILGHLTGDGILVVVVVDNLEFHAFTVVARTTYLRNAGLNLADPLPCHLPLRILLRLLQVPAPPQRLRHLRRAFEYLKQTMMNF
jgi:hypothetical protein